MRLAIAGAGGIALATAAQLGARGHEAVIWSPSGVSTEGFAPKVVFTSVGALEGVWSVDVAFSPEELVTGADAVMIAVDAAGHAPVMEAIAPFITGNQVVLVSAAHSLSGIYMARLLAERGVTAPVASWSTSVGTVGCTTPFEVDIRTIRPRIGMSVVPRARGADAAALCEALLGEGRFEPRSSAVEIGLLANANPVFHVPAMLLNISRIEHAEAWAPYGQTTPAVGRLMERLDAERLAIAAAYGATIHCVNEHFHRSFKTPLASMADMNAALHAKGRGPTGPRSLMHRYLSQDIPYGLVFAVELARLAGIPAPVHEATVMVASAATGIDYHAANTLLKRLALPGMTAESLLRLASEGWAT